MNNKDVEMAEQEKLKKNSVNKKSFKAFSKIKLISQQSSKFVNFILAIYLG